MKYMKRILVSDDREAAEEWLHAFPHISVQIALRAELGGSAIGTWFVFHSRIEEDEAARMMLMRALRGKRYFLNP